MTLRIPIEIAELIFQKSISSANYKWVYSIYDGLSYIKDDIYYAFRDALIYVLRPMIDLAASIHYYPHDNVSDSLIIMTLKYVMIFNDEYDTSHITNIESAINYVAHRLLSVWDIYPTWSEITDFVKSNREFLIKLMKVYTMIDGPKSTLAEIGKRY